MYVLSFRDMALAQCGAVTSAAMYDLDPISAAFSWAPADAKALRLVGWDEVGRKLKNKHVLFLVHGFNVNRDRGYTGLGPFAQEAMGQGLLDQAGAAKPLDLAMPTVDYVVPVLWPGDWYLPINYPFVLPDARATGRNFADFILSSASQMSRVSFLSHSFGVRVVLEAVQTVLAKPQARAPIFDTAILTAAAASDTVLDDPYYSKAVGALRSIVVVSSSADEVLSGAFPLGNIVEQALWDNDPGPDIALGHSGPVLTATSPARAKTAWYDVSTEKLQHGDYLPAPWDAVAGIPNGWSDRREMVAQIAQAALFKRPPSWPPASTIPTP